MITSDELRGLAVGDCVIGDPLMLGISPATTQWKVIEVMDTGDIYRVVFDIFWEDLMVTTAVVFDNGTKIQASEYER